MKEVAILKMAVMTKYLGKEVTLTLEGGERCKFVTKSISLIEGRMVIEGLAEGIPTKLNELDITEMSAH